MPRFDFPVVFSEPVRLSLILPHPPLSLLPIKQEYPLAVLASLTPSHSTLPTTTSTTLTSASQREAETSLFNIVDPEIVRENPVEAKHRRLVRSHRNGPLDRELKPNAKIRDELNVSRFGSPFLFQRGGANSPPTPTGNPPLPSDPFPHLPATRPNLAIPFLPHSGQTSLNQIPQIGRLVRPGGGETGGGDAVAHVG